MHQISTKTTETLFLSKFKNLHICIQQDFPTLVTAHKLNKSKFRISIRRPYLWNKFLTQTEKK